MQKFPYLGCDPEWFLKNKKGEIISVIGKIGGTKENPKPMFDDNEAHDGFTIQEDNVLLEYNIPPALCKQSWIDYHHIAQNRVKEILDKLDLEPHIVPSVIMPKKEMMDPRAWVFGCDPDYNAWTRKINPRPHCNNPFLRSAGGHIHIGFVGTNEDKINLVKLLDLFVAAPLALVDNDRMRRQLYGKPGAFRFKPYGLEYRTPSNFWTSDIKYIEKIYDWVMNAFERLNKFNVPEEVNHILLRNKRNEIQQLVEMYVQV